MTVGMDCTAAAAAIRWLASTSIVASTKRPPYSPASRSSTGDSCLQGSHQVAQKSTTTGTVRLRSSTSAWKLASVTSTTSPPPSGAPAAPGAAGLDGPGGRLRAASAPRSTAPYAEKLCDMPPIVPRRSLSPAGGAATDRRGPRCRRGSAPAQIRAGSRYSPHSRAGRRTSPPASPRRGRRRAAGAPCWRRREQRCAGRPGRDPGPSRREWPAGAPARPPAPPRPHGRPAGSAGRGSPTRCAR